MKPSSLIAPGLAATATRSDQNVSATGTGIPRTLPMAVMGASALARRASTVPSIQPGRFRQDPLRPAGAVSADPRSPAATTADSDAARSPAAGPPRTDAAPVRDHIHQPRQAGASYSAIAGASHQLAMSRS